MWTKKKKRWRAAVFFCHKKYEGGHYTNELDAAKRVNQLCDELGMKRKNPSVDSMPAPKVVCLSSQYKGVSWEKKLQQWKATVYWKKHIYGAGTYINELDAAKRVNEICDSLGMERKNPEVNTIQIPKKCVLLKPGRIGIVRRAREDGTIHRLEPKAQISLFDAEITKGWEIISIDHQPFSEELLTKKQEGSETYIIELILDTKNQRKNKIRRWNGKLSIDNKSAKTLKRKRMQCLEKQDTLYAQNTPEQTVDHETIAVKQCKSLVHDSAIQEELEHLIKILDQKHEPVALTIKKNLIAATRSGEKTKLTEINLRTENGESALSIAAQHGFVNLVQFLISNGADKEHFTNEHQTPLSLAVSQNHLKVVQVLLKDWISPNSHEEPYLHLLPIFNVKSREIAQLLVDNDAVTNGLYNNKNQSPLTVACQNGYLNVVQFFLDDGLDINHLDSDNKTPLFYAHTNGHHEIVNLLISKGANNKC